MKKNYKLPRLQATSTNRILSRPLWIRYWVRDRIDSNLLFTATTLSLVGGWLEASC